MTNAPVASRIALSAGAACSAAGAVWAIWAAVSYSTVPYALIMGLTSLTPVVVVSALLVRRTATKHARTALWLCLAGWCAFVLPFWV